MQKCQYTDNKNKMFWTLLFNKHKNNTFNFPSSSIEYLHDGRHRVTEENIGKRRAYWIALQNHSVYSEIYLV